MATRVHNSAVTWTPHIRIAWGGTLGGATGEIWTNSIKYVLPSAVEPSPADLDAMLPGVADAVRKWMTSVGTGSTGTARISGQAEAVWVKANYILASGLQRDVNTHQAAMNASVGNNPANCPFYQTFAVTFRSAVSRGRAHVGRIYPPTVSVAIGPDGRCSAQDATDMAKAGSTLINNLQTNLGLVQVGTFEILSPGNTTKGQTPLRAVIQTVEVDTVPDVQHRRTDRLIRAIGGRVGTQGFTVA